MSNVKDKVEEDFVLICDSCQAEKHHSGKFCQNCNGTKFLKHYIAFLGSPIEPSVAMATENPPARPGASSSGFMQLI